jgi:PHP family Zn ribbon phosphoesterase
MPIRTTCTECLAEFKIPDRFAGKTVKCKECTGHITVPGGEIDESDEEELEDRPRINRN